MPGTLSGKHILYDVSLVVNAVDLSDHVEAIEITVTTVKHPGAHMGNLKSYSIPGTLDVNDVTATFFHDFAAAKVYATLLTVYEARTIFNVVGKGTSAARSATNPEWTIPCFVGQMPIFTGTRGDRHMAPVTFTVAGEYSILTA